MIDDLTSLRELFPAIDQNTIQNVWDNSLADFNTAFERLLDISSVAEPELPEPQQGRLPIFDLTALQEQPIKNEETDIIDLISSPIVRPQNTEAKVEDLDTEWTFEACLETVLVVVPDVDITHVKKLYTDNRLLHNNIPEFIINSLFEASGSYPKSLPIIKKRKLSEITEDSPEPVNPYTQADRLLPHLSDAYIIACKKILSIEFPSVPCFHINATLVRNRYLLYPTYKNLAEGEEAFEARDALYRRLKTARRAYEHETPEIIFGQLGPEEKGHDLLVEYRTARGDHLEAKAKRQQEKDAQEAREIQKEEAMRTGDMFECQCCFGEEMWDQATHCTEGHLFCLDCCRRNAESEVGSGRYKVLCVDPSGCREAFPASELQRVLPEKTLEALRKNEQADILYQAGMDDLTQCPFCDYAAICPPIDVDKEFRCENPECAEVSCRHCKEKSHIPKSCEEHAKENKKSMRKTVEEAMTEALLRKCTKCGHKYIKESGCNKIQCPRCRTLMCYVCSKEVKDYSHFNDTARGGNTAGCPLFENTEQRHENEIREAEKAAIAKIREANPDISEEEMRVKLSEALEQSEQQKITAAQRQQPGAPIAQLNAIHQAALQQARNMHADFAARAHVDPNIIVNEAGDGRVNEIAAARRRAREQIQRMQAQRLALHEAMIDRRRQHPPQMPPLPQHQNPHQVFPFQQAPGQLQIEQPLPPLPMPNIPRMHINLPLNVAPHVLHANHGVNVFNMQQGAPQLVGGQPFQPQIPAPNFNQVRQHALDAHRAATLAAHQHAVQLQQNMGAIMARHNAMQAQAQAQAQVQAQAQMMGRLRQG